MNCPNCGAPCERDTVDVGPCEVPTGPWGCFACGWVDTTGRTVIHGMEGFEGGEGLEGLIEEADAREARRLMGCE